MKKFISIIICLIITAGAIAGCGGYTANNGKISIITTVFPEYDWVMQILGEKAEQADVTLLLDNGVDLHSYKPTVDDIVKISNCDIFIYVGGESDKWVNDVLAGAKNEDMTVIELLSVLGDGVKEEEVKEGMQAEEEGGEDGEEEPEYDEHVWLSLKNAAALCKNIADKIAEKDAENKEIYISNAAAYIEKLNALDKKYAAEISAAEKKTLLFGDRFPFRYLTDDYGLDYYAAFAGCSAESEASFETIVFLANKVDELGLDSIMQIESSDGKISKTVRDTTNMKNQTILTLDSMQSTTLTDIKNGVNYLSAMEKNLEIIKEALK